MRISEKLKQYGVGALLFAAAAPAAYADMADAATDGDAFAEFATMVEGWTHGGLGTGIALLTLLVGAGIGVARNSPLPALSGVASAAFLKWGPDIVTNLLGAGAVV